MAAERVFVDTNVLVNKVPSGGKQIHNANIVATMLAFDIPQLITYNVVDFQRFAGLITVDSQAAASAVDPG
jgi:hypothetical protein